MNSKLKLLCVMTVGGLFAFTGCASRSSNEQIADQVNTGYSITQVVDNQSGTDLTVQSVKADNGATITLSPSTIPAKQSSTFQAQNLNNGVQMWITATTPDGQTFLINPDVRKGYFSPNTMNGSGGSMKAGQVGFSSAANANKNGGGDNPTMLVTLVTCTGGNFAKNNCAVDVDPQ